MTGLSLNRWFEIMGFSPWASFQLTNRLIPITSECNTLITEYSWQNADRAGRASIRQAIARAEALVRQYALFSPTPQFQEVTLPYPQLGDTRFQRLRDIGSDGRWLSVALPEGQIQALGVPADSAPDTQALAYSDEDGDGLYETATCVATVPSGTTADQVVVRFLASDCGPVTPQPEIAPRSVSVSGMSATIVLDTWTLVRPVRTAGAVQIGLDPGNGAPPAADVCAPSVEVLRRRCDPSGTTVDTAMATLIWETRPWPSWWGGCCMVGGDSSDPAATATAVARAVIRNARAGIVAFGEAAYDATTGEWRAVCDWSRCRPPDRVTIRYQAGLPLDGIRMRENWAIVVARLAAAELARPICACTSANKELYEWQTDLSRTGATNDLFAAPEDMTNPLGSRRGQIYAWRHLQREQLTRGIYAG